MKDCLPPESLLPRLSFPLDEAVELLRGAAGENRQAGIDCLKEQLDEAAAKSMTTRKSCGREEGEVGNLRPVSRSGRQEAMSAPGIRGRFLLSLRDRYKTTGWYMPVLLFFSRCRMPWEAKTYKPLYVSVQEIKKEVKRYLRSNPWYGNL